MAETKGFMVYYSYQAQFNLLNDSQAGKLVKALMRYGLTGESPDFDDGMLQMAFTFMSQDIDIGVSKYAETCRKRSEAGAQGGRGNKKANALEEDNEKANKANAFEAESKKAKKANEMKCNDKEMINKCNEVEGNECSSPGTKLDELILIYGASLVKEYQYKVDKWCTEKNLPSKNTLETVEEWILQDQARKGTKNVISDSGQIVDSFFDAY